MPVAPMPIRIEKDLLDLLSEGTKRTPHKKQELIRITLRRHLREVIDAEATKPANGRITNVEPWPKGALAAAYKQTDSEGWEKIEVAVAKASRRPPRFDD